MKGAYPCLNLSDQEQLPRPVRLSTLEARSGTIYVVPNRHIHFLQYPSLLATHGSPYQYDTHIQLILSGSPILPGQIHQKVEPMQIALTLAKILNLKFESDFEPLAIE